MTVKSVVLIVATRSRAAGQNRPPGFVCPRVGVGFSGSVGRPGEDTA